LTIGLPLVPVVSANFFPEPTPQGIRIESNGQVNGTDKIERYGDTYIFTDDLESTIVVLCDSILIDGAGHTLQGYDESTGIFLQDVVNVTVKDLTIRNFGFGIKVTWEYIDTGSRNNTIFGNTITQNEVGLLLNFCTSNSNVIDNIVTNNVYGIKIDHSPNTVLKGNQLKDNQFNLWVNIETGVQAWHFFNDIDTSNTVDGKPVYYWVNQQNKTVPSDAGFVALINCSKINVENLVLSNNGQGIILVATNNSLITKNQIKNCEYGVVIYGSYDVCNNNTVSKNEISVATKKAIFVWNDLEKENSIYDNNITPPKATPTAQLTPTPTKATPTPEYTPEQSPSPTQHETNTQTAADSFSLIPVLIVTAALVTLGLIFYCRIYKNKRGHY
jgi:parallel beta-helix repeat protein